ncbi:MAG: hypothetical protein JNJ84_01805 [Rhodobacteraceae bacterium]|nr:hypothetical protein [Paracoccaceae bacterium]
MESMKNTNLLLAGFFLFVTASSVEAGVCDYRPSEMIGSAASAALGTAASSFAVAGATANAVGVYTLVHATSGLTMVGGTWAGASAAGTAGIIAGTGGAIGATVAVVTAPATITAAAVGAIAVGSFEGVCYFSDTRIVDYEEVDVIVQNIAVTAPEELYRYFPAREGRQDAFIRVRDPDSEKVRYDDYDVIDLYIVNGVLKYDGWINKTIGLIGEIQSD